MGTSQLWGANGELWNHTRIADWTDVGYLGGQTPPSASPRVTVSSFAGLLSEVNSGVAGVIRVANGTYTPTAPVRARTNQVIRGESEAGVIFTTPSLFALLGDSPSEDGTNNLHGYSWDYGLFQTGIPSQTGFTESSMSGIGFESFTVKGLNSTTTPGHHQEFGFNAFDLRRVSNAWIRNVTVLNCDNGILSQDSDHFTIDALTMDAPNRTPTNSGYSRGNVWCHHGIHIKRGTHYLVKNYSMFPLLSGRRAGHDQSVEGSSATADFDMFGVWKDGTCADGCFDYHRRRSARVLWDNINIGVATDPWHSGGASNAGPNSGPGNVWWNIIKGNGTRMSTLPSFASGNWHRSLAIIGHTQNILNSNTAWEWVENVN